MIINLGMPVNMAAGSYLEILTFPGYESQKIYIRYTSTVSN